MKFQETSKVTCSDTMKDTKKNRNAEFPKVSEIDAIIKSVGQLATSPIADNLEQVREAYASYRPSFMELKVPFNFQGDLEVLSDKDLGTLLHEYVHYLQNLLTPWGLYSSIVEYGELVNVYRAIQEAGDEINIPVKPYSTKKIERQKRLLEVGNGFCPFLEDRTFKIDRGEKISLKRKVLFIGTSRAPEIICTVKLDDGTLKEFVLGASIIKESMAGMMQRLIDPSATFERDDIPYNFIRILCEDIFENVAKDPIKMITVCYLSLFSMSPGEVLINGLDNANRNINLAPQAILDNFMANDTVTMDGNRYPVYVFYGMLRDRFVEILEKTLTIEATYVREALDRADITKGYIPILSILYGEGISRERVYGLMNGIGFPWLWTEDGIVNAKISDNDSLGSADVNLLVCHNAIFSYLYHPNKWRCCPLRHICLKGQITEDDCWENKPWEGKTCVMSEMASWLGLDNKTITFKA